MGLRAMAAAAALLGAAARSGDTLAADGATLFKENCSACHQPAGQGVPGAFPALAGDTFVVGDPRGPAYVVTHGRGGMPNFSEDLDDTQIAAILSFVRSSWGNKADALTPDLVAKVRSAASPPNQEAGLPFH